MRNLSKFLVITLILIVFSILSIKYADIFLPAQDTAPAIKLNLSDVNFSSDVQSVLAQRCVVCHACYDAPCQLKLGSYEGITRGAHKDRVYDGERLLEGNLTRLFEDAHTTEQWREEGFFSVLSNPQKSEDKNLSTSVMAQLLTLKQSQPLPNTSLLPDNFALDLNEDYTCPDPNEIDDFKKEKPLMGMPYGLPKLTQNEHLILENWLVQGASGSDEIVLSHEIIEEIETWESFLNEDSLKSQLMSRYLFEHLFLVHLYFENVGENNNKKQFFKLIRSATAPPLAAKGIFTRRPFDDPQVERVYYRLVPIRETLVHKAHMPLALSNKRLTSWTNWFIKADYTVEKLPSYLPEEASNPFITFAQIPVKSRYKYMLAESQNTIMQFIKGPVCRGQMALNVINDHFWVLFIDPESALVENHNEFLQKALQNIALPAEEESTALPTAWISYATKEREYLHAKSTFIKKNIANKTPINLDLLWDGEKENQNLALTVFRHNDAASVVKGLIGEKPQTAWLLSYPLFERIHYLLVAGYDVYGNLGHQLNSRMYMDFLRMEGEFNFLSLLPEQSKKEVRNKWYSGSVSSVEEFVYEANTYYLQTDIKFETDNPLDELYQKIKSKLSSTLSTKHEINNDFSNEKTVNLLQRINKLTGSGISYLPESAIVQIYNNTSGKKHFYTLLRHSAHTNISHLFGEEDRRLPENDTVTIAIGFMTSHPNAFMKIEENELGEFVEQLTNMRSESDYRNLMDAFGIRRTNKNFWHFSDNMHKYFQENYPIEFGYLDFNRLENR